MTERLTDAERYVAKRCRQCGEAFLGERRQIFCKAECRVRYGVANRDAAYNRRNAASARAKRAERAALGLCGYCGRPTDRKPGCRCANCLVRDATRDKKRCTVVRQARAAALALAEHVVRVSLDVCVICRKEGGHDDGCPVAAYVEAISTQERAAPAPFQAAGATVPPATGLTQERSGRAREVRARRESVRRLPRTRGDCVDGPRPCPFVSCKHHLYLDVSPRTGAIKLNFPALEVDELTESCSLDVADQGGKQLERIGALFNITSGRVGQIEAKAIAKVKSRAAALDRRVRTGAPHDFRRALPTPDHADSVRGRPAPAMARRPRSRRRARRSSMSKNNNDRVLKFFGFEFRYWLADEDPKRDDPNVETSGEMELPGGSKLEVKEGFDGCTARLLLADGPAFYAAGATPQGALTELEERCEAACSAVAALRSAHERIAHPTEEQSDAANQREAAEGGPPVGPVGKAEAAPGVPNA